MEQTQWPDAEKLKELRQAGVFPFSRMCLHSLTTIAIIALTYFFIPKFSAILSLISEIFAEPISNFQGVKTKFSIILGMLQVIFCTYAGIYLAVSLLTVFIQSKFYFSLINFAFNLTQIAKVRNASFIFFFATLTRGIIGILAGILIGGTLFYWISAQFIQIIYSDKFYGAKNIKLELLEPILKSSLVFAILLLSVLSVLSYLAVRFGFMLKHRTIDRFGQGGQ